MTLPDEQEGGRRCVRRLLGWAGIQEYSSACDWLGGGSQSGRWMCVCMNPVRMLLEGVRDLNTSGEASDATAAVRVDGDITN